MASSSAKVVYIKTANDEILTLKINLVGAKPKIWRRVKVPGVFTLGDLHYVIQIAMGWENYHLHVFRVGDRSFAIPMEEDPDFRDQDADSVTLSDLHLAKEGARFSYEYDFGDGWEHEIIVERVTRRNRARSYPYCEKRRCALAHLKIAVASTDINGYCES